MRRTRRLGPASLRAHRLLALLIVLLAALLPPHRPVGALLPLGAPLPLIEETLVEEAAAAPNIPVDPPAPPPLAWPAVNPIVPSDAVGYLAGGGTVTSTGEYAYQIPLDLPAGRMGVAPALSLVYSSRGGNGVMGVGWSLAGVSEITRCGKTIASDGVQDGIDFDAGDALCLDGRRLVLVSGSPMQDGAEYRTEPDSFARIVTHGDSASGPEWIEVATREGIVKTFAPSLQSVFYLGVIHHQGM